MSFDTSASHDVFNNTPAKYTFQCTFQPLTMHNMSHSTHEVHECMKAAQPYSSIQAVSQDYVDDLAVQFVVP